MSSFGNLPIKHKLTTLIMASTLLAVLLLSILFVYQSYVSSKLQMSEEFTTISQIISDRSNAAVLFEDSATLNEILASLELHKFVELACIFNDTNELLASYTRIPNQFDCATDALRQQYGYVNNAFHSSALVLIDNEAKGRVYIRASTQRLDDDIAASITSALTLASIVILAALLFARYIQRFISDPLIQLQGIARKVTVDHDFSPRANKKNDDELGELVDAFNTMLETIAEQNQVIREHTDNLEKKVDERTAELALANRELETFSYSVSHDLKAPLNRIEGFSLALIEDYGDQLDKDAKSYIDRIRSNSREMRCLINSLLQLSKVARKEINKQDLNLSDLANHITNILLESDPDRKASISIRPGIHATGDQKLIEILLDNLIGNAWKYSRNNENTRIEIGVTHHPGSKTYFIRDNGSGFDMEYAGQLFKPFSRLHSPEQFEGTGIGLATVARIVERHHGKIWAESAPDQGAIFYFTLFPASSNTLAVMIDENTQKKA